ncbi:MAG: hypothetical protein KDB03_03495 [Planctomycetales bacterium]|nr:hypothetical protein [Planctomycetales bacterium]
MLILVVSALGIAIVLLSILVLRLNPLLGLLLGSLFLLLATPRDVQLVNELGGQAFKIQQFTESGFIGTDRPIPRGEYYLWRSEGVPTRTSPIVNIRPLSPSDIAALQAKNGLMPAVDLLWHDVDSGRATINLQDKLIAVAAVNRFDSRRFSSVGKRLSDGFGKTFLRLGIPVTMAALVGICLLESHAAARLVSFIVSLFGPRGTGPALTVSGFVLGVPVFFENVFYLLLPLAKAIGRQREGNFVTAVMAIIVGATMAHSLVPPTPGPLAVCKELNVSIGMMMIGGSIVGGIAASIGYLFGTQCHRWIKISMDQMPKSTDESTSEDDSINQEPPRGVPLWLAALPIALPIAALSMTQCIEYVCETDAQGSEVFAKIQAWLTPMLAWTDLLGDAGLVFIGSALISIFILRRYGPPDGAPATLARGISDAGTILMLTCAGGAFGASLQQLQIADAISTQFGTLSTPWGLLVTSFVLTAIIRAAQGSATVAMLTSSAIVAPVMTNMDLPFHPVYVALAIGCGSKPLPWMNDSGFWQIATMTGMTSGQTLRSFTAALTIMGIVGFGVTLAGAIFLPLK